MSGCDRAMEHVVEVKTLFELEDNSDELIVSCPARYEYTPERQTVEYDEYGENGECTHTRVTSTAAGVDIDRSGTALPGLRLRVGERQNGVYSLEFGSIEIEYTAERIDCRLAESGGVLEMRYSMSIGGIASTNTVRLTVSRTSAAPKKPKA